jgi:ketosteroid isomerase-like protein
VGGCHESRTLDLLDPQVEWLAAQPGPWDCHDREQVIETFRRQYDHGVRADFGEPVEVGDKVILDVRPYRRDQQGNKIDEQRLWQVLTMRGGKIVRIQDHTDQASASKRSGCPPAHKGVRHVGLSVRSGIGG